MNAIGVVEKSAGVRDLGSIKWVISTNPTMIAPKAATMSPCTARNAASVSAVFSRHLVKLHNEVLDQRRFDAGMAEKAETIVSQLEQGGRRASSTARISGRSRQGRSIAHIDREGERCRQMTAKRVGTRRRAVSRRNAAAPPRRRHRPRTENAGADTEAKDGQTAMEKVARQAEFRAEARKNRR